MVITRTYRSYSCAVLCLTPEALLGPVYRCIDVSRAGETPRAPAGGYHGASNTPAPKAGPTKTAVRDNSTAQTSLPNNRGGITVTEMPAAQPLLAPRNSRTQCSHGRKRRSSPRPVVRPNCRRRRVIALCAWGVGDRAHERDRARSRRSPQAPLRHNRRRLARRGSGRTRERRSSSPTARWRIPPSCGNLFHAAGAAGCLGTGIVFRVLVCGPGAACGPPVLRGLPCALAA